MISQPTSLMMLSDVIRNVMVTVLPATTLKGAAERFTSETDSARLPDHPGYMLGMLASAQVVGLVCPPVV